MVWTHDRDAAHDTEASVVRLLIGDTDSEDPLLTDEEVGYFVEKHKQPYSAASACALAIAARFAKEMATSTGDLSADFAAKHSHYLNLADILSRQQKNDFLLPSQLEPRVDQQFHIGQMDNWRGSPGGNVVSPTRLRGYDA